MDSQADADRGSASGALVAVLIPCFNEQPSIGKVVADFRSALPEAKVFVYDNGSTDATASVARRAGAVVRTERTRGKGNVVRRMFADIEADVFVLVDGDDTYDAGAARLLLNKLLSESLDMVQAARVPASDRAYRPGHRFGNRLLTGIVRHIFGSEVLDMLTGYRVFSRRFVKSFPLTSSGFEVETELQIHAFQLRLPTAEVPVAYRERPEGSASKLHTYSDGLRILRFIVKLLKEEKPLAFFGFIFLLLACASVILEIPVIATYLRTGLVPRLPTALLGTGLGILAFLSLTCGLILETVTRGRVELKRLHYLSTALRFNPVRAVSTPSAPAAAARADDAA
ncbi:MAG: glycosyltransferase [Alphaproteobacteria bacterium]|nr:glycosyltransferase [Alphaproteobacteria bacterium]